MDITETLKDAQACNLTLKFLIERMGRTNDRNGLAAVERAIQEMRERAKLAVRDVKTFTEAE